MSLVLAGEAVRKFGGDSVAELRAQPRWLRRLRSGDGPAGRSVTAAVPGGREPAGARRAGRHDGDRQDHDRPAPGGSARPSAVRLRRDDPAAGRARPWPSSGGGRGAGLPDPRDPGAGRGAPRPTRPASWPPPAAWCSAAVNRDELQRVSERRRRGGLAAGRPGGAGRPGPAGRPPPLLATTRRRPCRRLAAERETLYAEVADRRPRRRQLPRRPRSPTRWRLDRRSIAGRRRAPAPGRPRPAARRRARDHGPRSSSATAPTTCSSEAGARHRLTEVVPVGAQPGRGRHPGRHRRRGRPRTSSTGCGPSGTGEDAKSLATVEELCRSWSPLGPDPRRRGRRRRRRSGDRHGRLRGRRLSPRHRRSCTWPPPCSAQVDAAIGGKTGVNLPEGKNLVGVVLAAVRRPLRHRGARDAPAREYLSGCGEMAKYHFLGGDGPASTCRWTSGGALRRHQGGVSSAPTSARAAGGRCSTTATPWPTPSRPPRTTTSATARPWPSGWSSPPAWPGAWVASTTRGSAEHRRVVAGYDLPVSLPPGLDPLELVQLMARDKKATCGASRSCSTARAASRWWRASTRRHVRDVLEEMQDVASR